MWPRSCFPCALRNHHKLCGRIPLISHLKATRVRVNSVSPTAQFMQAHFVPVALTSLLLQQANSRKSGGDLLVNLVKPRVIVVPQPADDWFKAPVPV